MRFPIQLNVRLTKYILGNALRGRTRYPFVLMLEPTHLCNLACEGCGKIREFESTIRDMLPLETCLKAVEECGAPIVSICGGEPFIYKDLPQLVAALIERNKHIYLCTNGMFIRKRLREFQPSPRLWINVHLDGMKKSHDLAVERDGVFDMATDGIKYAKENGFQVCTNTTVYVETDMNEIEAMFEYLEALGVDAHMISPGYSYSAVQTKEIFLDRTMVRDKFKDIKRLAKRFPISSPTPIHAEFLSGERELRCTAWGNPTFNTKGWKGPCYLITDQHHEHFSDLMNATPWERYGYGKDPRCENCLCHCGYEASAAAGRDAKFGDTWKMLLWNMFA